MLKAVSLALVVSAALLIVGAPASAADRSMATRTLAGDRGVGSEEFTWSHAYRVTPLEYKRLRAIGLNEEEIAVASNAARLTGRQDVELFVQAILRGETAHSIAAQHGLAVSRLLSRPEYWQTEAWRQAVERGDPWWVPSGTMSSVAGSRSEMRDRR
jgi:hypothetical protein